MKIRKSLRWKKVLIIAALALLFGFSGPRLISAQSKTYEPGQRVECDWMQNGKFESGTVAPFSSTDIDKSGRWYRVKLDSDKIPNSTTECLATHLRPLATANKNRDGDGQKQEPSQPTKNEKPQGRFKPGDRVECDKAQIGVWEKGTVVNYLPADTDRGSYMRVRLDGYPFHKEGHQCMMSFIRSLGQAAMKASGKYKVGDAVEAQNSNGSWLPAHIVAVEGAFYKVHFDDRDERFDEKIDDVRIRAIGSASAPEATQPPAKKLGTVPKTLPGTAWKIDFGRGETGTLFRFCPRPGDGWEIVPQRAGSTGAVGRSYSLSGSTLTMANRDDGMVQRWKMSWEGDVLVLNDGKVTLRLHYNGETQCR
jgi:hypothetical protein